LHLKTYGKNDFAEISKNLVTYKFENNFVESSKQLCRILELVVEMSKLFVALLIKLKVYKCSMYNYFNGTTKLFSDVYSS